MDRLARLSFVKRRVRRRRSIGIAPRVPSRVRGPDSSLVLRGYRWTLTRAISTAAAAVVLFTGVGVTTVGAAEAPAYGQQQVAAIAHSGIVSIGMAWN